MTQIAIERPERLASVLDSWEDEMRGAGYAESTIAGRLRALETVERWLDADPRWVTAQQLVEFLDRVDLMPVSRKNYMAILRPWFAWLLASGRLDRLPLDDLIVIGRYAAIVSVAHPRGAAA